MKKLLSLLTVLALAAAGCKNLNTSGAKQVAIDCAKQDLGKTVTQAGLSLLMTVASILFDGANDWQAKLTTLAEGYGVDAVKCAAKVAEELFRVPTSDSGSGTGISTSQEAESPHDRAVNFTSGTTFKN